MGDAPSADSRVVAADSKNADASGPPQNNSFFLPSWKKKKNQAVVARFENLAGRAAMISFLVAAGMEAGGRPFFASASEATSASAAAATATASSTPPLFAAGLALAAALATAAGAAASVPSRPGDALLEPVVVSLTGAQRALGAISVASLWAAAPLGGETANTTEAAAAVDGAVDAALDRAFGAEFLAAVLGYGDEDILA